MTNENYANQNNAAEAACCGCQPGECRCQETGCECGCRTSAA